MKTVVGRPLKFSSPEDLLEAINTYLTSTPEDELTVTGLALSVGTNRQVLIDYEEREGYADIVKQAKCIIENSYEKALRKTGRSGDIFALKNFGWKDQQHIENTGENTTRLVVTVKDDDAMDDELENEY